MIDGESRSTTRTNRELHCRAQSTASTPRCGLSPVIQQDRKKENQCERNAWDKVDKLAE